MNYTKIQKLTDNQTNDFINDESNFESGHLVLIHNLDGRVEEVYDFDDYATACGIFEETLISISDEADYYYIEYDAYFIPDGIDYEIKYDEPVEVI